MRGLNIPLEEFLRPFFKADENVCIRVFSDRKGDGFKGQKLDVKMGRVEGLMPLLKSHNGKNRGIFFVVNYGGHEDKDIKRVNAHFVENDNLPLEEQYKRLMAFPLEPSLIVKTKKSLHGYWLIRDGKVESFRKVQLKLAEYFDGDRSIVNESRVLRLPGFYHCKGEKVQVQCIKYNPELRYTQEELLKYLPKGGEERRPSKPLRKGRRKGLNLALRRCEFLKHCQDNAKSLSEADWYAMITNLAVFEGGREAIHRLSCPYPGYSLSETEDKIEHFLDSKTLPMKCSTIGEKGFKCPKLLKGGCNCKSPGGLAFLPLDLEDLMGLLNEQPLYRNVSKDMAGAAKFIEDYLFNVDEVTAEPFITSEIKRHFDLKNDYLKILLKKYRELFLKYRESREKKAEEDDLPPWYEPTERGLRFLPGILANHMSKNVPSFYSAEDFYIYESGVYRDVNELVAGSLVREHMIDSYTTLNGINDVCGQWKMLVYKDVNQLNSNPFIINLKNGLYNILDGTLNPHTPEYLSIIQLKASYAEGAKCPRFMEFLNGVLGPPEVHLLQEIFGYLLIPVAKAQKSFVFVGPGNAGKSTLLSVAQDILLGSEYVSNITWQAMGDRFKTAELFGKLANIFADLPNKSLDDNGIFKTLTGEDYITAEKKNKNPFSFKNYARFLFSCNEVPRNYGDRTEAFYRRLIIIRFKRPVPLGERDSNLKEKLEVEGDGIFMWALEGLKRLMEKDYVFSETETTRTELQDYRIANNSVLSFFHDCCSFDEKCCAELGEIYKKYKDYCDENGLKHVSKIRLNKEVRENFENIESFEDNVSKRMVLRGIHIF